MKKTLAIVMAAAMAASMSTVAFAYNANASWGDIIIDGVASKDAEKILMGKEKNFAVNLNDIDGDSDWDWTAEALADLMNRGYLSADVIVTSGKEKLASLPSLKVITEKGSKNEMAVVKIKFKDTWGVDEVEAKVKARFTAKKTIEIGDLYTLSYTDANTGTTMYITKDALNKSSWDDAYATADLDKAGRFTEDEKDNKVAKPADAVTEDQVQTARTFMRKGDTITSEVLTVKGFYNDVDNYGESITMTPSENDNREIIARGEDLYDNAGSGDKVTLYFGPSGDVASFEFKVSNAQKDLNLGYDTNAISDVIDAYPEVDFEFINFKSRSHNVLTNKAKAVFNAIGGKNTTVYEWDGSTLKELPSKYDSIDDTVVVEGIKRLTSFVISEKELVAETQGTVQEPVDEPEETTAAPAPSQPSNNDNPSTGAL